MDAEPVAETTAGGGTPPPPPSPPDEEEEEEEEEAHLGARTSASRFWLEFSLLDDGLDAPRAAALALAGAGGTPPRFHRFPDLPPEIRLKIWSYLVAPRVVTACCLERDARLPARRAAFAARSLPAPCRPSSSTTTTTRSSASSPPEPMVFNPTCPVLLLVCRESRALGLARYDLAFAWRVSPLLSDSPVARPARAWFNFRLDALYLAGALEARDRFGFDVPVVGLLPRRDARRVRRLACAFADLRYPDPRGPDQAYGCLWHLVGRFPRARRLLVALTPRDEDAMRAGPQVLRAAAAAANDADDADDGHDGHDVVRKIWDGWVRGTTVTSSSLADTQILLVREADLADVLASHAQEDEGGRPRRVAE